MEEQLLKIRDSRVQLCIRCESCVFFAHGCGKVVVTVLPVVLQEISFFRQEKQVMKNELSMHMYKKIQSLQEVKNSQIFIELSVQIIHTSIFSIYINVSSLISSFSMANCSTNFALSSFQFMAVFFFISVYDVHTGELIRVDFCKVPI